MIQVKQAFTLVELIVVVTILAILATIGFVSYSGYLTGVRDTNRVASLTAISDGLELYRTKNDLPLPDNSVEVQVESETIARQGYAGSNVLQTIEYSKAGKDPKDDQYYSYYLTDDKKHYQMMAFLEESDNLETKLKHPTQPHPNPLLRGEGIAQIEKNKAIESNVLLPSPLRRGVGGEVIFIGVTHAATDYSNRHPKVYGKRLGILTDVEKTPIQEITTIKTAGNLNIQNTGMVGDYISHLTDVSTISGTGTQLISGLVSISVGKKFQSCREILEKNTNTAGVDGMYNITLDGSLKNVYCDMTTQGGGFTQVLAYNGERLSRDKIDNEDWYQDKENYSHLYSFKDIKNSAGKYEFYIRGFNIAGSPRWFHFTQTNSYDQNPVGNGYIKIAGNYNDTYYSPSIWNGLSLGSFGNSTMQGNCSLATSYGNATTSSWWNCLMDNTIGYGTGPWSAALLDTRNVEIYQK